MPIHFTTSDTSFRFSQRRFTRRWLEALAHEQGGEIAELSVVFCSDSVLLEINRQYLAHDYLTDIITFPYMESEGDPIDGELMISVDTVRSNSETFGATFAEELQRVLAHGLLHLLGWGDATEEEAAQMRTQEERALALRREMVAKEATREAATNSK